MALTEPTPGERRNGWTAESLTRYLRERTVGCDIAAYRLPDRREAIPVVTADSHDLHDGWSHL